MVSDCFVDGVRGNHFAYSACHNTHFIRCTSIGTNYAYYNDTDSVDGFKVTDGSHLVNYSAVSLVRADVVTSTKSDLFVEGTDFRFDRIEEKPVPFIGVSLIDRFPDARVVFDGINFKRCRFQHPRYPVVLFSTDAEPSKIRGLSFEDIELPAGSMGWSTKAPVAGRQFAKLSRVYAGGVLQSQLPDLVATAWG